MNTPASCGVLIVGAGPTGLMLAGQLGRWGVPSLVVDQNPGPSVATKALGVHARTLEIYAHLGIAEPALTLGARATGANLWVDGERAARVPLGDIGRELSPFPFLLILGQDDNERLLGDFLSAQGTVAHWNTELIGLSQTDEHVLATLRQGDGSIREIKADWVAGCDGPHSAVRSLTRIAFPGAPYEHTFFVADTRAIGPMVPGELNIYLWRRGFHLFFPMRGPDHWRVVGILPAELRVRDDLQFDAVAPAVCKEVGSSLSFQACSWFSTYRIHHRRAERFRDRRCFLLGDAAHIHSPVGAQGMNTGLQDAYNLAWKLAWVSKNWAVRSLLDSYEIERIPVADRLLKTTDEAFSLIVSEGWLAGLFRVRIVSQAVSLAMRIDRIRKFAFRTVSQIGIRYPKSQLSLTLAGLPKYGPKAGDRFPWLELKYSVDGAAENLFARLDDTRLNLILIGQPPFPESTQHHRELIRTHRIPDDPFNHRALARARIPNPSFYLLRPDGHVGLAGVRLDAGMMRSYLEVRLCLKADKGST